MKSLGSAVISIVLACGSLLFGQSQAPNTPAVSSAGEKSAKVSDLAFLSGHWQGQVEDSKIEQVCSGADPEVMVCMFRLMEGKETQMLEFYTLRNTPAGVEERIRFFSPDLKEKPGDPGVTLLLASYTPEKLVFENPTGTYPKRATLTRKGDNEFSSHIELIDAQGKSSFIDAHWTRTK